MASNATSMTLAMSRHGVRVLVWAVAEGFEVSGGRFLRSLDLFLGAGSLKHNNDGTCLKYEPAGISTLRTDGLVTIHIGYIGVTCISNACCHYLNW